MRNKILSYLLWWILVVLSRFMIGVENVQADCDCPEGDTGCRQACHYESQEYKDYIDWNRWWQQWWGGWWTTGAGWTNTQKECPNWCCGIKLNTNFPIIWNCIWDKESENPTNAFPTMIWAITKIVMSLIFVVCFILIIISGIMWASDNPSWAKNLLKKVAVTILILWLSGVILKLINPNFFS